MSQDDIIATQRGPLTIRRAEPGDLEATVAIEENAAAWLRSRGIEPGQPPRPFRELFAPAIARGAMYLALRNNIPAAKVAITDDDGLWADQPDEALYVHGLMVHRDFAGQDVGAALLRWVEGRAVAAGKMYVRLDCNADNPALRAYYERTGFAHRGDVALAHRTAARYEKAVAGEPSRP